MFSNKSENLLSYVSATYNKALNVYELATSQANKTSQRAVIVLSETYTLYQTTQLYSMLVEEKGIPAIQEFQQAFDEFYVEVKKMIIAHDVENERAVSRLAKMKQAFENLTAYFNEI